MKLICSIFVFFLFIAGTVQSQPLTTVEDFSFAATEDGIAGGAERIEYTDAFVELLPAIGTEALEGDASLKIEFSYSTTQWVHLGVRRYFDEPFVLDSPLGLTSSPSLADLDVRIAMKGDPNLGGGGYSLSLFLYLIDADGDEFLYWIFVPSAIKDPNVTPTLVIPFLRAEATNVGDNVLSEVVGFRFELEDPDGDRSTGTLVIDDLRLGIKGVQPPDPFLTYSVNKIPAAQAPNVQDTVFDVIYASAGNAITGDDWKDWSKRDFDKLAPIGPPLSTSEAYFISDGERLYFGMKVYDPNTSAMTPDSGNDTFNKWAVESVEVGLSPFSGTEGAGASNQWKFAFDAFGHIDDMIPDGDLRRNTSALQNHNSYIIDTNTWACEFSISLAELMNPAQTNPEVDWTLPAPPGPWYGHIGYQSPFGASGVRVPLYAAANGNGFAQYQIKFDLSHLLETSVSDWYLY